jgi:DNA modification methylase
MDTGFGQVRLHWPERTKEPTPPSGSLRGTGRRAGGKRARGSAGVASDVTLVSGDNLAAITALTESLRGTVTLAYMDPPFLTGRQHMSVAKRSKGGVRQTRVAFDDRWDGLIEYLTALEARVSAARELLADDGSLIVHIDSKTSHYVKVMCDEVFGIESFASEIIWRYRRWPSRTPNFQRMHDTLLRYVKNPAVKPRFNQLFEPLAASTRATWGDRKQRAVVGSDGRRQRSSKTAEASPGTPLGDVWEIGIVAPVAKERTGYPTQKPRALLQRILESCTNEGDLVIDPYMGSGTTVAVCAELGRRAIGIDASPVALETVRTRLGEMGVVPDEYEVVFRSARRSARSAPATGQVSRRAS